MQRLYKSRKDKVLDGICGGIGHYFNVDAVIIRIIWVLATIFSAGGFGILAYLIAMVIIPREPDQGKFTSAHHTMNSDDVTINEEEDTVERIAGEVVPVEDEEAKGETNREAGYKVNGQQTDSEGRKNKFSLLLGLLLIIFGGILLLERLLCISLRALFFDIQTYLWPLLLVGLGVFLLTRRSS